VSVVGGQCNAQSWVATLVAHRLSLVAPPLQTCTPSVGLNKAAADGSEVGGLGRPKEHGLSQGITKTDLTRHVRVSPGWRTRLRWEADGYLSGWWVHGGYVRCWTSSKAGWRLVESKGEDDGGQ
jgi:hypothetical protein